MSKLSVLFPLAGLKFRKDARFELVIHVRLPVIPIAGFPTFACELLTWGLPAEFNTPAQHIYNT